MEDKKLHGCIKLVKLLDIEKKIISRHIDEHKWLNHISNLDEGIADFIQKFGWIMKEMYCEAICDKKEDCEIYAKICELDKT